MKLLNITRAGSLDPIETMPLNKTACLLKLGGTMKIVLLSMLIFNLTACFGKGKSDEEVVGSQPAIDMTRPPVTIKDSTSKEEETNPDETVSFEKWKKDREGDEK